MKNIKNTISALGLMAVLGLGAVAANAGLMISDRSTGQQQLCAPVKDDLLTQLSGIIILGAPMLDGIIILGRDGLMISDKGNGGCNTNGLMISDRSGLMISD
ncbi:MAG: hypothetical protein LH614_12215 [Pyrinomonadaceae bacterium]|nr:hypothetical protein [Pyrinomonadaceae bacterium]